MTEPRSWYALLLKPGPAIAAGQRVSEHPAIGEHFAFLQRLAADGSLIAAGPLTDVEGEALAIVQADSLDDARRLAEQDDPGVLAGALAVQVRPWQVLLAPVIDGFTD